MSFSSKKNIYTLVGLVLGLAYSLVYWTSTGTPTLADVSVLGVFSLIQLVYVVGSWNHVKHSVFDAYIIFALALYAFSLGQPILETLGFSQDFRRLWNGYGIATKDYYTATYVSMLFILFFHLGSLFALKPEREVKERRLDAKAWNETAAVKKAAIIISFISAPFYLYNLAQDFVLVSVGGYAALYEDEGNRIVGIMADLFAPALMAYFCACLLQNKDVKQSGFLVAVLLFLPPFYLGGRSSAMIIAALVLIVYASIRTINKRKLIMIGALAVGMLAAMHIIAVTRTETGRTLESLQQASDDSENPAAATISEMGWTMYPLALTIEAVPSKKDYSYGASYFWAFVSLVPNVGLWNGIHPGKKHDPGYWINRYSDLNYGIGYSITAGAYNELGMWGCLLMFLYGRLFCQVFAYVSPVHVYRSPLKFIFALLFLWFAIKFIRNSYDSFMRNIFYDVLPMYLLTMLYVKRNRIYGYKNEIRLKILSTVERKMD